MKTFRLSLAILVLATFARAQTAVPITANADTKSRRIGAISARPGAGLNTYARCQSFHTGS